MSSWLYRYETKGIQSWILDSNLLRDLAGGSALVEDLTGYARNRAEDAGGEVKQATSGAMTAVFRSEDALARFAQVWPLEVSLRAPGLQLVQTWVREEAGLSALFRRLDEARNTVPVQDVEVGPWVYRAGNSGLPAVQTPDDIQCEARATDMDLTALAKELACRDQLRKPGPVTGGRPWSDFNLELDRWVDREGLVAVIHADGTGVGKRLLGLGLNDLEGFSDALKEATTAATDRALGALWQNGKMDARPIVSAGDDLTYIVPACHARAFATEWLLALEEETEKLKGSLGGEKITGGAGIVLVHRKYPFSRAYEMAETLCSAAKKKLKDKEKDPPSVLAFRRITSSWIRSIEDTALAWRVGRHGDPLGALAAALGDLPRGTLRTWLTYFEQNDERANQLWQRAREVNPREWMTFVEALEAVGGDPETGTLLDGSQFAVNLDQRKDARATPVRDAIALRYFEKEAE